MNSVPTADSHFAERQAAAHHSVTRAISEAVSLQDFAVKLLEALCGGYSWDVGTFWALDGKSGNLRYVEGWAKNGSHADDFLSLSGTCRQKDAGVAAQVLSLGAPVWLSDVRSRMPDQRLEAAAKAGLVSAFGYPLRSNKEVIGVVEFFSVRQRDVNLDLLNTLDVVAAQVGLFWERKRVEADLERSNRLLGALTAAQSNFIETEKVGQSFTELLSELVELSHAVFGFICEVDSHLPEAPNLRILATQGADLNHIWPEVMLPYTVESLIRLLTATGRPVVTSIDPQELLHVPVAISQAKHLVFAPLKRGRELLGLIGIAIASPVASEKETAHLSAAARTCALILEANRDHQLRAATQEALADSEQRMAAIVSAAADGILAVAADGSIESINASVERMFGYRDRELTGVRIDTLIPDILRLCEDSSDAIACAVDHKLLGTIVESRGMRKDGSEFAVEVSWSEVNLADRLMYSAIVRDISERKRIDKHLKEFYSIVSHELKTPLTSIVGAIGLIEGGTLGEVSPLIDDFIKVARKNCDRLTELVNDVVDIEQLDANKLELTLTESKAGELVRTAVDRLNSLASQRKIKVQIEVNEQVKSTAILADRERVSQVLSKLLSNALKFAPKGSVIDVKAEPGHELAVRFSVIDQGPGIPNGQTNRVFDKFEQLDASDTRKAGGVGLGLAICRELIKLHGGLIGVDSREGAGSTFWIELPAAC